VLETSKGCSFFVFLLLKMFCVTTLDVHVQNENAKPSTSTSPFCNLSSQFTVSWFSDEHHFKVLNESMTEIGIMVTSINGTASLLNTHVGYHIFLWHV